MNRMFKLIYGYTLAKESLELLKAHGKNSKLKYARDVRDVF